MSNTRKPLEVADLPSDDLPLAVFLQQNPQVILAYVFQVRLEILDISNNILIMPFLLFGMAFLSCEEKAEPHKTKTVNLQNEMRLDCSHVKTVT